MIIKVKFNGTKEIGNNANFQTYIIKYLNEPYCVENYNKCPITVMHFVLDACFNTLKIPREIQ